jgi:hypothetical protein
MHPEKGGGVTAGGNSEGLVHGLRRLLPNATMTVIHEQPWRSLTFVGTQLCLSVTMSGNPDESVIAQFIRILPDYEFDLTGQLVADIGATEIVTDGGSGHLRIDALLLND